MNSRIPRIALLLVLAVMLILPCIPIYAETLDDPVNFASGEPVPLSRVFVNRHLISPNDMLIYFVYCIKYDVSTTSNTTVDQTTTTTTTNSTSTSTGNTTETQPGNSTTTTSGNTTYYGSETEGLPDTSADLTYIFRLFDTDGSTVLGYSYPYPFKEGGYNYGIGGIYFNPDQAPTWEGAYILSIQGNPAFFGVVPEYEIVLNEDNYGEYTTQINNQDECKNNIIAMMHVLELQWGIALTTQTSDGPALDDTGSLYAEGAIPGLHYAVPALYTTRVINPDYDSANVTWGTNLSTNYTERYGAYSWVGNFTGGVGGLLGGGAVLGGGIIIAGLAIACLLWASIKYQSIYSGFIGSLLVLMCGFMIGFLPGTWFAVIGFLIAGYTGIVLFLQRSS